MDKNSMKKIMSILLMIFILAAVILLYMMLKNNNIDKTKSMYSSNEPITSSEPTSSTNISAGSTSSEPVSSVSAEIIDVIASVFSFPDPVKNLGNFLVPIYKKADDCDQKEFPKMSVKSSRNIKKDINQRLFNACNSSFIDYKLIDL